MDVLRAYPVSLSQEAGEMQPPCAAGIALALAAVACYDIQGVLDCGHSMPSSLCAVPRQAYLQSPVGTTTPPACLARMPHIPDMQPAPCSQTNAWTRSTTAQPPLQPVGVASLQASVEVSTFRAGARRAAGQAGELPPLRAASRGEIEGEEVIVPAARGRYP